MNVKTIIYRFVVGSSIKFLYLEKYDVVALGELLVDFTMNGNSEQAIHSLRLIPEGQHVMYCQCCRNWENMPPFLNKATIETTGAGDTFMACVLNSILK